MSIRVLLVDDHAVVLEGLKALFLTCGVDVVGQARTGRQAVEMTRKLSPHLVLMDIGMPQLNGIEATRQITAELPGTHVIALSVCEDARSVRQMLRAGARGYLVKSCDFGEVARAVDQVMECRRYISPEVAGALVDDYMQRSNPEYGDGPLSGLTSRESEVLQLLVEGRSAKEIARDLHISDRTVHTHRQRLMEKLGARTIPELTKLALREGVTQI